MQVRPIAIERGFTDNSPGSVLYRSGKTVVLCTASLSQSVPDWMSGRGTGWLTAEYSMLPHSTASRKARDRGGKIDGRGVEIQRLIGRALRGVVDLSRLGERTLQVDCDVLQADGGTRTAAISGATIAVIDALMAAGFRADGFPMTDSVAAVSVGIVGGQVSLDLDYKADVAADVDMNVVMTGRGRFIEIQGTGEEATFDHAQLNELLAAAQVGIEQITAAQRAALDAWPFSTVP